jgi:ferrous iron transport protein A
MKLADLAVGCAAHVQGVQATSSQAEWPRQLAELGFIPGEPVRVLRRAWPGGDPMVVRIGSATFALRREEAACVEVQVHAQQQSQVRSQEQSQEQGGGAA